MGTPYVRGPTRGQKRALEEAGLPVDNVVKSLDLKVQMFSGQMIVRGETYDLRDQMRALGGIWVSGNKWWRFNLPVSSELLALLSLDAPPSESDGEISCAFSSSTPPPLPAFLCSNGKSLTVAKCFKTGTKCHTCKGGMSTGTLMLGMSRTKTISRGAGYFGDGSKAWSKLVDWTDWSHLDCLSIPKLMLREMSEQYDKLGGWEMGVEGVSKLNAAERARLAEKCPPSDERITMWFESVKADCPKLPVALSVLVTEYLFPMDPALVSELGAAVGPPPPPDFSKFTVAQLKTELQTRGLDTTGRKQVLLDRLLGSL